MNIRKTEPEVKGASVRLSPEMLDQLWADADANDRSLTATVRVACREYLERRASS